MEAALERMVQYYPRHRFWHPAHVYFKIPESIADISKVIDMSPSPVGSREESSKCLSPSEPTNQKSEAGIWEGIPGLVLVTWNW
jgi:hypothetical protein